MGQEQFARDVNTILARNRLAYELQGNGKVRRLLPPVLREALASSEFTSEDPELNRLLESARTRFSNPDFHVHYDALRDLWDAFERLKTLEPPRDDPRRSSTALIARVSREPSVQAMLDTKMRLLNDIGNGFSIRHANAAQVHLQTSEEIDYLFHRLFAIIDFSCAVPGAAAKAFPLSLFTRFFESDHAFGNATRRRFHCVSAMTSGARSTSTRPSA